MPEEKVIIPVHQGYERQGTVVERIHDHTVVKLDTGQVVSVPTSITKPAK